MKKIILLILIFSNFLLISQEENKEKKKTSEPFDLPNAIIYGDAQVSVSSGIKQFPSKARSLNAKELDSINSLEKQQLNNLNPETLRSEIKTREFKDAYLITEIGRFTNPKLELGYKFNLSNYSLFANGGFDYFGGHITKSDYTKANVNLVSDYIAPEKFWLFGGSKTRTSLLFNTNSYYTYADANPIARSTNNLNFNLSVDGDYNGFKFYTGGGFKYFKLNADSTCNENGISAYLKIINPLADFNIGLDASLNMNTLRGKSINLIQTSGFMDYVSGNIRYFGKIGLQISSNSNENSYFNPLLNLGIDYKLNRENTFKASLESSREWNEYSSIFLMNPYLSFNSLVDFEYNLLKVKAIGYYHPLETFNVSYGVSFALNKNIMCYIDGIQSTFDLVYLDGTKISIFADGYYKFNEISKVYGTFKLNMTNLSDSSTKIPYMPMIDTKVAYNHSFNEFFNSNISLNYFGSKFADISNKIEIPSYINLSMDFNYAYSNTMNFNIKFNNILNQEVYIWNKYLERGLYVSLGLTWQF